MSPRARSVRGLGNGVIGVRDSKAPAAGRLAVGRRTPAGLIVEIKAGRLDL